MYLKPNYKQYKFGFIKTSEIEIRDLARAWLAISVAFAIVLARGLFSQNIIPFFIISLFSVGVGFIVHELGHKVVAQHYGCFAEFRAFNFMLWMAIFFALIPPHFLFAAPGAVMIQGPVGIRRNGKISMAGPLMNIVLAIVFLSNLLLFPFTGFLRSLFVYGFMINTWLALFNMIPIGNFDGKKILRWNKLVYGLMVGVAFIFMLLQGFYFSA